jgi:DNA-binding transcriptional regulator YiaG
MSAKKTKPKTLTHDDFQLLLGERIKEIREELGLSQVDFAEALEVTQRMVSRWEQGITPVQVWHLRALTKVTKKKAAAFIELA